MSQQIDPQKAIYLKLGERTLPSQKPSEKRPRAGDWVAHERDVALDEWGVAIRVLR